VKYVKHPLRKIQSIQTNNRTNMAMKRRQRGLDKKCERGFNEHRDFKSYVLTISH
jgi:hypothetical protein